MEPFELPPEVLARYPYLALTQTNLANIGTAPWTNSAAPNAALAANILGQAQYLGKTRGRTMLTIPMVPLFLVFSKVVACTSTVI